MDKNQAFFWKAFHQEIQQHIPKWNDRLAIVDTDLSVEENEIIEWARKISIGRRQWEKQNQANLYNVLESVGMETGESDFSAQRPLISNPLTLDLPTHKEHTSSETSAYETLINAFIQYFPEGLQEAHPETLLTVLHKYATYISITYSHLYDVSLYDHIRSFIGICLSIKMYIDSHHLDIKELNFEEDEIFRMIGADLSGIQTFIYDIVSKYAAKNLKGRSFYLSLLTDSLLQQILQNFGLLSTHIIYSSGGGFFLLAPNLPKFEQKLQAINAQLQKGIYQAHNTILFLALDSIAITPSEFFAIPQKEYSISNLWQGLIQQLNLQKRRRFAHQLVADFETFFTPQEVGGLRKRDAITDEEFTQAEFEEYEWTLKDKDKRAGSAQRIKFMREEEKSDPVKVSTHRQILLGMDLRKASYWVSHSNKINFSTHIRRYEPCQLGIHHYFLTSEQLDEVIADIPPQAHIRTINNVAIEPFLVQYPERLIGFTFYGGNLFPTEEGEDSPISTDQLVGEGNFKRIGLLRMDVDNLGQLFISGFKDEQKTFSRYSALSRQLDFFFKGYLNTIIHTYASKHKNAYILYSGGDDLFILGKWNAIIQIAQQVHADFSQFTNHNSTATISGGLAILGPKFPIMLGATYAGAAEKQAKGHSILLSDTTSVEKNAFSMLNTPLNWEKEFPIVEQLKNELLAYLPSAQQKEAPLSEAILGKIGLHYQAQQYQRANQLTEKWYWTLVYDFSQIGGRIKKPKDKQDEYAVKRAKAAQEFVERIKKEAITDQYLETPLESKYTFLNLLYLAARWADLEMRTAETIDHI